MGEFDEGLAALGGDQLTWERPSDVRVMATGYRSLPDDALDDPEYACELAREANQEG